MAIMLMIPPLFLEQVERFVLENIDKENLSTENLAAEFNLSSSQIYRRIMQKAAVSPSVFIRNIRLEQAYYLIEQSDLNLSEIADRVGFSYLSYFSRCFTERYGYPPSNLRH